MPKLNDEAPQLSQELLAELKEHAEVLSAYDEAQDVALDLHETPFSPATRDRALRYLHSPEYEHAARAVHGRTGTQ